jgi:hypothetical protein
MRGTTSNLYSCVCVCMYVMYIRMYVVCIYIYIYIYGYKSKQHVNSALCVESLPSKPHNSTTYAPVSPKLCSYTQNAKQQSQTYTKHKARIRVTRTILWRKQAAVALGTRLYAPVTRISRQTNVNAIVWRVVESRYIWIPAIYTCCFPRGAFACVYVCIRVCVYVCV